MVFGLKLGLKASQLPLPIRIGCTTTIALSYVSHIKNEKIDDMGKNSFVFVNVAKVRLAKLFSIGDGGSCNDVITILKTSLLTLKEINKGRDRKGTKERKEKKYRREKKIRYGERGGPFVELPSSCFPSPSPNTWPSHTPRY